MRKQDRYGESGELRAMAWGVDQACGGIQLRVPPRQNISYFNSRRVNHEFCGDRKFPL